MQEEPNKPVPEAQRVRLTICLSISAYHAILDLQRRYRTEKGRVLPIWKAIDTAVRAYAQKQDTKIDE